MTQSSTTRVVPASSTSSPIDRSGLDPASFVVELRDFLATNHPGRAPAGSAERLAFQRAWQATLADAGWIAPGWPRRWGGMGLPTDLQAEYHREMTIARTPVPPTNFVGIVGPTILTNGTDEQRERYLAPMLRADELWCQGFSEPDAGSDLSALRTRAVLDGDVYRVDGRKIWTSKATIADYMLLLARTGSLASRSRGITCLILKMDSPGVEVRPLRDMTGAAYFAEVTFDAVEIPVANRIGEHDDGWRSARVTMGHERSTSLTAAAIRYQRVVGDLVKLARERDGLRSARMRQRIARLITGARLLELNGGRVLDRVRRGEEPGPVSSVSRLQHGQFEQELHETALALLGSDGLLAATDPNLGADARWVRAFLFTRASTIGAGTAEVQRNTIAEKVLGLPTEPDP
jgi:alkylation response protein AidB-like acyl-CoA dehydrogenase